jgi:hypothetical protein
MRSILFLILFQTINISASNADQDDPLIYSGHVFNEKIKSVQLNKEGWNLSFPAIKKAGADKLLLNFDLLGDNIENYYYTFIHCTKDWQKSDIFPNDYLEGFPENQIEDYENSFNTTVNYIHYRLSFPNERISFKISGNYILVVYPQDKPDEPVLTRRFIITEDALKINITVRRPLGSENNNSYQQVEFTANYTGLILTDPSRYVFASILQNGRWDNVKTNLKPDMFGNNELKYNSLANKHIFRGGNEFRNFDIKTIKVQTEFVKKIEYLTPNYNIYLHPSENREFKPYFYSKDFNGKFFVAMQDRDNPDIDADYVYVYFTLPSKQPVEGGKMYVSGELNDWQLNKNNLMTYNKERAEYECTMLLKQGWYNYEYVFVKGEEAIGIAGEFEGSHYETENDYIVLFYYRNPRERYDRVIGSMVSNTLNRISN